MTSYWIWLVEF